MDICITVDGLKWRIEKADGSQGRLSLSKVALILLFLLKESTYFFLFFKHECPTFLNNHAAGHPASVKIKLMLLIDFN